MNVVAIVPARGGSKGVPRKNIRNLAGHPLLWYTTQPALASHLVTHVLVSTEDKEIAAVARSLGAEVVDRPAALAQDDTPTEPVMLHALEEAARRGIQPNLVVLLQPTSPFRTAAMIDSCCQRLIDNPELDSVVSLTPTHYFFWQPEGSLVKPLYTERLRRQDLAPQWRENGSIYVTRCEAFRRSGNRVSGHIGAYVMDQVASLEIDTEFDFWLCERIISDDKWHLE